MEITLEQVERLREKADVSYGQAKQALEYSGGNLLDALIYLEEQGAIPRPQGRTTPHEMKRLRRLPPRRSLPLWGRKRTRRKKERKRSLRA